MPIWLRSIGVAIAASLFSAIGVAYAVLCSGDADDGGRAGSLVVALSFGFLFLGNRTSDKVYRILTEEIDILSIERPTVFDALKTRIDLQRQEDLERNRYLAIASVIGTLFWGFGDRLALTLMA